MPTPCYLLEPTDTVHRWLRRYVRDHGSGWTCEKGWHTAKNPVEDGDAVWIDRGTYRGSGNADDFTSDSRWPTHCEEGCGYEFTHDDEWQLFDRLVYRVTAVLPGAALAVGAETTIDGAPPGAMWDGRWYPDGPHYKGADGRSLIVKLPDGHQWLVDGTASNCTRKGDTTHKCWVRDGEPPYVTAGKDGETCAAGAGSIATPGYHGFLRDGVLT